MNIQALMKQAQQMQKDIQKSKEEIDKMTFDGESSFVKVKVNGKKEVIEVKISEESKDLLDDLSILEDMILIATNNAIKKVDATTEQKMGKYANIVPGMM